ncbi:hypothetical protein A4X17_00360 [Plantibacter sp. H53]|uniref:universal stress protein n=1 Tax=Plantibacter sp. H53 TaxID=1827323 RepID=UPI0007D9FD22|nr:universal stress protein [Plantibacter sp. H53]OAN35853.1 hypothetical protein A4X17_00360 [Plantibacter sp. H53]
MNSGTDSPVRTATTPTTATSEPPTMPVVVGVDGSEASMAAFRTAARLAPVLDAPLRAVLVWQFPNVGYAGYPTVAGWAPDADAQELLRAITIEVFGDATPDWFSTELVMGTPAQVLAEVGTTAQLLVTGGHEHGGLAGIMLGSVSEAIARHAPCPVLVLRGDDHQLMTTDDDDRRSVVVGVDGSVASLDALRLAADFAERLGAPLRVVLAWHEPISFSGYPLALAWSPREDARTALTTCTAEVFGPELPAHVSTEVIEGRAAPVLINAARDARLLVMGARGRDGFAGLMLGSATEACVRHAAAPILVVPDRQTRIGRLAESTDTAQDADPVGVDES